MLIDLGMYRAMTEMWGRKFCENMIICGDSAGSILAVSMALGNSPEYCEHHVLSFATLAHHYGTMNQLNVFIELKLREMISDPYAYKRIEGKCYIGATAFFSKHIWRCQWNDNEDLIQWILYSCRIPLYFRRYRVLQDAYIDGALSIRGSDLPCGDDTLAIILNDPRADVVQSLPFHNTYFPAIDEGYTRTIKQGYDAMFAWDGTLKRKEDVLFPSYFALFIGWFLFALEKMRSFLLDVIYSCLCPHQSCKDIVRWYGWKETPSLPDMKKLRMYLPHLDSSFFQLSSSSATTIHDGEESCEMEVDLEQGIVIDSSILLFDESFYFGTTCTHYIQEEEDSTVSLSQQDSDESVV